MTVLPVKRPNQQYQSTKDKLQSLVKTILYQQQRFTEDW